MAIEDQLTALMDAAWPDGHRSMAKNILAKFDVLPKSGERDGILGNAQAEPNSTLWGQIAAVYGQLDAEDCKWIDREWAKQRGYILPDDGTNTLSRALPVEAGPVAWLSEYDGHTAATTDSDTVRIWRETLNRKITPLYATPSPASKGRES